MSIIHIVTVYAIKIDFMLSAKTQNCSESSTSLSVWNSQKSTKDFKIAFHFQYRATRQQNLMEHGTSGRKCILQPQQEPDYVSCRDLTAALLSQALSKVSQLWRHWRCYW